MSYYAALDLDRTTFKTEEFTNDISVIGADMVGISAKQFVADSKNFRYISNDRLSHYDFFAQLEYYGIPKSKQTIDDISKKIQRIGKTYVYSDVKQFISQIRQKQYQPFVLTYGESVYQSFKVNLCPELVGVPFVVVQEPKRIHLASTGGHGVLFDDVEQELLPSGWRSELIDRQAHPNDALIRLVPQLKTS